VTDEDGNAVSRHDYEPFGVEFPGAHNPNTRRFTGHERDFETGLDYMGARFFDVRDARFTGVDSAAPRIDNPQRYNRYSYAGNNPLKFRDDSGNDFYHFGKPTQENQNLASTALAKVAKQNPGLIEKLEKSSVPITIEVVEPEKGSGTQGKFGSTGKLESIRVEITTTLPGDIAHDKGASGAAVNLRHELKHAEQIIDDPQRYLDAKKDPAIREAMEAEAVPEGESQAEAELVGNEVSEQEQAAANAMLGGETESQQVTSGPDTSRIRKTLIPKNIREKGHR
jgi:RHS repeat-associated protein